MRPLITHDQALFQIQVEIASYKKNRQTSETTLANILAVLDSTKLQ